MSLVALVAFAHAADPGLGWVLDVEALAELPAATRLEAELAVFGVESRSGSIVTAARGDAARSLGDVAVQRRNLGSGRVDEWVDRLPARGCASVSGAWRVGELRVHTLPVGTPDADGPQLILVEGFSELETLVTLAPGDSVELRRVSRQGAVLDKRLIVRHGAQTLELRTEGARSWVCTAGGASQPVERPEAADAAAGASSRS